jgi:hypothetical protein
MRIFVFSILLIGLLACKSKEKTQVKTAQNAEKSASLDDFVSLDRTACFGTCPIYQIKIFRDGKVLYFGKRYVENEGTFQAQMDKEPLNALFSEINSLNWESFPTEAPMDNVDFPQFRLEVKLGDFQKTIRGNTRADESLIKLSKKIDALFEDLTLETVEKE